MRFTRAIPAILGMALLLSITAWAGARAAATPAGAPRSSVELEIGDCAISGETSGIQDDALTVVHRDPGGALRASHTFDVSGGGWLVECPGPRVRAGDRIQLLEGATPVRFRTFIVPDLSIRTARAFDRIRGTAPRVSSVDLELSLCDVAHFGCTTFTENDIPVNTTTRRWSFTSGENLRGGSSVTVRWEKGLDRVSRSQRFAQLIVSPGSATVTGTGPASGRRETVSLRRGEPFASASRRTKASAAFRGVLKRNGGPVKVRKGDVLASTIAGDAALTVPATAIAYTGTALEGRCRKNRPMTVLVRSPNGATLFGHLTTTDGAGDWSVPGTVDSGNLVEAWCATPAGDAIVRRLTIP